MTSSPPATDAARWTALTDRDRRADAAFRYGVKTTGVYCRPTCPSRLPRRENVVYFPTNAAAERAGFRACMRCRPQAAAPDRHGAAIARACATLDRAERSVSLNDLAAAAGYSPSHFHRLFTRAVGLTPKQYATARRLRRVREGLTKGVPVTTAIYDAGFNSSSRFYETAADQLGMRPVTYRHGAPGIEIRYAVGQSSLGWFLVAATERGLCAIELGESPEALSRDLGNRFPRARLRPDAALAAWVEQVAAVVEVPQRGLDLPLDVQGTAFQRRVWQALRAIPAGATATYAEIATRIGQPRAARAVAGACAANPLAVAIPCHRVVRADGALGGYRWGADRKRALLAREAAAAEPAAA